jgi:dephospho-CoA kinase
MLKVGLTGGIGAGKSIVASIFRLLNVPVYDADTAAKNLMNQDEALKEKIIQNFGSSAYLNGSLNRPYISAQVFSNKEKLELLNSLVHPATIKDANKWFEKQQSPYVIKEAALLFESGTAADYDYVIGVTAPEAMRIKRAMNRDNATREQIKERMKNQMEESIKMKLCDYIIHNDERVLILPQILQIHKALLQQKK